MLASPHPLLVCSTGKDKTGVDENSVLVAVAVFVSSAPTSVTAVPGLQCQAIELFKKTMHSDEPLVRHKTMSQVDILGVGNIAISFAETVQPSLCRSSLFSHFMVVRLA